MQGGGETHPLSTTGGVQELRLINEPDMYALIFGSKLPSAERFKRWVFEEVLPSIRKTGQYTKPLTTEELLVAQSKALLEHKQEIEKVKAEQEKIQKDKLEQDKRLDIVEKEIESKKTAVEYFTIIGYASLKGLNLPLSKTQTLGRAATKLSRQYNVNTGSTPDARYGRVKTYAKEVLEEVFENQE